MMFALLGYYLSNSQASFESIQRCYDYIDRIIPNWLELNFDGSLKDNKNKQELLFLTNIKKKNKIIPMVQNFQLNSENSNLLLADLSAQKRAINGIIQFLKLNGFLGINLDLEGIKILKQREYSLFVEMLADNLHKEKFILSLSIPAKTKNNKDTSWSGAYKYDLLGNLVDEIIIMAYDFHWPGGLPGPIAPLFWVQDVLDFAIIKIPTEKTYLGIPFYGYDWIINKSESAKGLSYSQIISIKNKYNIFLEWDQESQSPYFKYKKGTEYHEVWFENKESIKKKINLVKEFQLAGAAFWRLGLEDKKFWQNLNI